MCSFCREIASMVSARPFHHEKVFQDWTETIRLFVPRYNARVQFLIAQTRILRRWGAGSDHNIDDVMAMPRQGI